ncbi:MAG: CinA family nicotinamide mononucleotide deamidase-related protein [Pseudomonadota bacterium]
MQHAGMAGHTDDVLGDEDGAIKQALGFILARSDAVVVTGGLGPTADDITTQAIARAFGLELYTDEAVLRHIRGIFEKYRLNWTENNAKQAVFPEGAEVIANPVGTAAGFALKQKGKLIAVLPGVPREIARMLPESVLPILQREFPEAAQHSAVRTIKSFGLSEAAVDKALADLDFGRLGIRIGFYPNFPENHIVLTAIGSQKSELEARISEAEAGIVGRLKKYVFAYDGETLEGLVAKWLTDKGWTLAVAESCTGGLVTDRLTDIPGSSIFLERSVVTYSNAAKTELLGVPADVLEQHGAVSEQTARLMAEGVRKLARTDLGLAITGIAGPAGGTSQKPVGTVYIALADGNESLCRHYAFRWDRRRNKIISSQAALLMLKRYLAGEEEDA